MKLPPFSFAVLDTETTGFVPKVHRVIEYAGVRIEGGEVVDTQEHLFAIDSEIPPSPCSEEVQVAIIDENPEAGETSAEATEEVAERSEHEKQDIVMETEPAPTSEQGEGSITPDDGQPLAGEGAVAA